MDADGGDVVMLDPASGEVLAVASERRDGGARPSAFIDAYEPGSVAKIFTAAALIADHRIHLADRVSGEGGKYKMLDRTLVVLASEFGRDALTEGKVGKEVKDQAINIPDIISEPRHYGMHRHFTAAGSILMFGGGIKKGFVYGKTADERPCTTIENPVVMEDLHATMYHALGIAPDTSYVFERRPVYVTRDGKGEPILDLFA
jgi:hypothetical protein